MKPNLRGFLQFSFRSADVGENVHFFRQTPMNLPHLRDRAAIGGVQGWQGPRLKRVHQIRSCIYQSER